MRFSGPDAVAAQGGFELVEGAAGGGRTVIFDTPAAAATWEIVTWSKPCSANSALAALVLVKDGGDWRVAAFQNTRRPGQS